MEFVIGVVALVVGVAIGYWLAPRAPAEQNPVTDKGKALDEPSKAKPPRAEDPQKPDDDQAELDEKRGKTFVRRAKSRANCVGFALGRGDWEISTTDLPGILKDGYDEVADGKAEVCNIIVYGVEDKTYSHIVLVIEVDAKGNPKVVRGKEGTSPFVYDTSPDKPFGKHKVYNRKDLTGLPKAQQDKIKELKEKYDKINDKSSKEAHDAAEALCQEKNALKLVTKKAAPDK